MVQPLPHDLEAAVAAARARLGPYAAVSFRESVASTNDVALEEAAAGRAEGVSIVADVQTAGRGRRGHEWFSPPGAGLYLSVIVRPRVDASDLALVTLASGAAVAEAVADVTGLPVELKWPNDVVIGRPWRKLGGLLCETSLSGPRIDAVVVGIGINVTPASYPPALRARATSIEGELGRSVDRAPVLVAVLTRLKAAMALVHAGDREGILRAWRVFGASGLDRAAVRWEDGGHERRGRARDLDRDGALLVEVDGGLERIVAGEVTWETWSRG